MKIRLKTEAELQELYELLVSTGNEHIDGSNLDVDTQKTLRSTMRDFAMQVFETMRKNVIFETDAMEEADLHNVEPLDESLSKTVAELNVQIANLTADLSSKRKASMANLSTVVDQQLAQAYAEAHKLPQLLPTVREEVPELTKETLTSFDAVKDKLKQTLTEFAALATQQSTLLEDAKNVKLAIEMKLERGPTRFADLLNEPRHGRDASDVADEPGAHQRNKLAAGARRAHAAPYHL